MSTTTEHVLPAGKELELFFDGDCPLCAAETKVLRRLDRRERVIFTNIAAPDFNPAAYGKTMDALMAELHARLPDGTMISGMDAIRRLYAATGLGWIAWFSALPGIRALFDVGYRLFAKNRLRLTGRCHDGACRVNTPD